MVEAREARAGHTSANSPRTFTASSDHQSERSSCSRTTRRCASGPTSSTSSTVITSSNSTTRGRARRATPTRTRAIPDGPLHRADAHPQAFGGLQLLGARHDRPVSPAIPARPGGFGRGRACSPRSCGSAPPPATPPVIALAIHRRARAAHLRLFWDTAPASGLVPRPLSLAVVVEHRGRGFRAHRLSRRRRARLRTRPARPSAC